MKRQPLAPRPDWQKKAEEAGFTFHTMYGEPYWDETSAYGFTLEQIENDLEDPSTDLHQMCREAAAEVIGSEELMEKLGIPASRMNLVAESWAADEPELYGRFDLAYDGKSPAKLLEYNADTPTSLFEAGYFQWGWLEGVLENGTLPEGADQFNSIHEALVERFREILHPGSDLHCTSAGDNVEDYGTVEMLGWAAKDAGITPHYTKLEEIGLSTEGQFIDNESRVIGTLFKLYPWEDLFQDEYSAHIRASGCRFIEPAWKAVLSNKGILPVLWQMFEGHPNLLPAFFEGETEGNPVFERARGDFDRQGWVSKPLFSREGASVSIHQPGAVEHAKARTYDHHPKVLQLYQPLPVFDGMRPVIGAWIIGRTCRGIGIREDEGRITQDLSRFKPHFIWP